MTPEQYCALADALEGVELALPSNTGVHIIVARDFLRTAADQLGAVREWMESSDREPNWDALEAILTADTAPQDQP